LAAHGVRQADLRAFANSGTSPVLGCLRAAWRPAASSLISRSGAWHARWSAAHRPRHWAFPRWSRRGPARSGAAS